MLFLQSLLCSLLFVCVPSVVYLYYYPTFHRCGFPLQDGSIDTSIANWISLPSFLAHKSARPRLKAPFRLLALGDPQLEGDSSIPNIGEGYFPTLRALPSQLRSAHDFVEQWGTLRNASKEVFLREIPAKLQAWRKQVDLFGNDYYLAHIYRTLHRHADPTHVTVLGDLLGSQWIDDEEFEDRAWRFWQRVVRHGKRVGDEITGQPTQEILGTDEEWERRVINVVGNHDVGYAGDMTEERIERFERNFGKVNWEIVFQLPSQNYTFEQIPELRIIVLNSMNLDTPAKNEDLQSQTYKFINDAIIRSKPVEDRTTGTILLTHIPLEKPSGVCVDGPFFDFHGEHDGGGVKEQNHISYEAGRGGILEGIYGMSGNVNAPGNGMGRNGIILTGHDHEGCDVYHHLPAHEDANSRRWNATRWHEAQSLLEEPIPGIREITVRSMMGDFGGNAGLLSAWFDHDIGEWQFAYSTCSVGVQHIWWAVHVLVLVTLGVLLSVCVTIALDRQAKTKVSVKREHREQGHRGRIAEQTPAKVQVRKGTPIANGSMRKRRRKAQS
jgi:hypothetical protein